MRTAYPSGREMAQMMDWSDAMSAGVLDANTPKQ